MMTMRKTSLTMVVALLCATLLIAGCADNPNRKAGYGAGIGTVVGGLAGAAIGKGTGAIAIGAAVGALAGGASGHYMDRQQQDLDRRLQAEQARNILHINRLNGDALKIGVASDASFAVDSATLSGPAQSTFNTIAEVLKNYHKTAIHVVGFTDSTGSDQHNQKLSQERAAAVANFLTGRGVNSQRVLTWGRGESQPVASNDSAAGRARNRRVDIVIKPIVKGQEQQAFSEPPYLGS